MSAQRPQHFFVILALGVGAVSLPRVAAAQGCVAHTCTAVNRVTVTVPPRLALSPAPSGANQGASPAAPAQAERRAAARTAIRDTPAAGAAVRYTLVAS